jgi:hypothetical protein
MVGACICVFHRYDAFDCHSCYDESILPGLTIPLDVS